MKQTKRTSMVHWLITILTLGIFVAGSIVSVLALFGGPSNQTVDQLEATSLGTIETDELVGTNNYLQSDQGGQHTLLAIIATSFHLPFNNPEQMLLGQLPAARTGISSSNSTQNRLFQALTTWESQSKKINLGWIPDYSASESIRLLKASPGITVISPGWFTVKSRKGKLSSTVQPSVVQYAHSHHVKVWAMVTNQFSASLSHQVLESPQARQTLIEGLAKAAQTNHLDGINVDFENLESQDEGNFTTFIKELHQALAPLHVTLSVDITKDIAFLEDNAAYFHAGLAENSDYVILMAYDEHWGGDPEPGPVADVPWVTQGVNDLLDTGVPADKLILGIPLYARFWHVYPNGQVTSEAVADANIGSILSQHNATVTWNQKLGIAYARYPESPGYEEVWYETVDTLNQKLQLVSNDGLAGIGLWSLNLSSKQTWNNVLDSLRQSFS